MDMNFTAADEAFRLELRNFVQENLPSNVRLKVVEGV
jgi:hypothetical protein